MRNYLKYKDEDVIKISGLVSSMAQLLKGLGLKEAGGNYANMRKTLQRLNLSCDHWTGQGWSKDKQTKDWSDYNKNSSVKKHLIKLRGNKCEICLLEEWLGKEIKVELHHINGDRTNNEPENLQLLCPNCHSFTNNFRSCNKTVY